MKKSVIIALREKSAKDLQKHLLDLQKTLVETKVKHHMGQIKDTSVFAKTKSEIALVSQLLTKAK